MKNCIKCGSHAFNLCAEGIDQGGFCDVHYWQTKAQRPWAGLTNEEAIQMFNDVCRGKSFDVHRIQDFYKAIESALRSKNYD